MLGTPFRRNRMLVSIREFIFVTLGSAVLSLAMLAARWPWARQARRLVTIGLTTATALNVDSPVLGLGVQDVGSGVAAFVVTRLVLRLVTERAEPAGRVLGASGIIGVVTIPVD